MMYHLLRPLRILTLGYTLPFVVVFSALSPAESQSTRMIHVTVTDGSGRFVTGIDKAQFEIVQNGIHCPITGFSDVDAPISLAIVTEPLVLELAITEFTPGGETIQTLSLPDALRQLSASKNQRKTLIVTAALDRHAIPPGIQVVQAKRDDLVKAVVEVHNEYLIQFESADSSERVEVLLKQPRGLPPLRVNLK
jgi:hypothetical protein